MTLRITTYHAASDALRQRDLRQALYDEGAVIMDRVLVNLHGDEHRARRNLETKVFRRDFFRYYEQEVFPATLAQTLAPFLRSGRMDLVEFGYRVMVNLTADFTGIDRPRKSAEESDELVGMLRVFGRAATLAAFTGDRDSVRAETRTALARFDACYVAPSAARRIGLLQQVRSGALPEDDRPEDAMPEKGMPRDVLSVLIANEDNIDLPDDVRLREIAFFGLAGAHTSIHTLSHAMHELFTWGETHPEDAARVVNDPLFLQRCVHESIRLHPSSQVAMRRALCPVHLTDRADAQTGDEVAIDLEVANRDVAIFGSDAAQFNPHRVLPRGVPPYGLSFGLGMHACVGLTLAAGVLQKSDVESATHHLGTVALIAQALLRQGARPDPNNMPQKDQGTTRDLWAHYPLLLNTI